VRNSVAAFLVVLLSLLLPVNHSYAEEVQSLDTVVQLLQSKKFNDISKAIELLSQDGGDQAQQLLLALQDRKLYKHKSLKVIVIAEKENREYRITNVETGEDLGSVKKSVLKKVRMNNRLRSEISSALAIMNLKHPDADVRLASVNEMLDRPDPDNAELLQSLLPEEKDERVAEVMSIVIALANLTSDDKEKRSAAVSALEGNVHPAVRNGLDKLLQQTDDPELKSEITRAINKIDLKLQLYSVLENIFFGLSLGSVLVLAAIGLAITFGVMGVINMAHGELIMIGAYTTYVMQLLMPESIGLSVLLSIPAAFIVSGLVGIAIERGVIRFLYGRPLETLLATFGISIILQQAVRSIFSPLNRSVETPSWMSGVWEINNALSLTLNRLYIIVFCLLVFAALFMILKKTPLGLQVRAVSQNRAMARAMGVRSERVDALTFGLGSGIAGVAGVALSQLTNVGPNLGQAYIIDSFMVVVFGGVGNLWGTLVSGMTLGVANKFLEPWTGAVLAKILVLVFIILFIQKRPRGLFPQKGRAAEN
jgi:urea transport system permease protein